jgi:16S rRNA (uracil1498-N3)-methyltransferase
MPRLFLSEFDLHSGLVSITGEKARYLATVLRCRPGDPLFIYDDDGSAYSAKISSISGREVTAHLLEKMDFVAESHLHITLLQGLLKGDKMDLVIQKATELGVKEIVPVITGRSQVRETRKVDRWRKIAGEAARQAGRNTIPEVRETIAFKELDPLHLAEGIIFWEQGGEDFRDVLCGFKGCAKISLFTGPEGGFSEAEIEDASKKGLRRATLGKRILRAETAAIAAVAITQYALGDIGDAS